MKLHWLTFVLALLAAAAAAIACTREVIKEVAVEKPVIVERQVIKEVPVERLVVVEKQVVKEVPVEKIVTVEKEVVREVDSSVGRGNDALRFRLDSMPARLVPHVRADDAMAQIGGWVWSRLAQADPRTGRWVPDLAERWDVASDFGSMTFYLRKNALWHDGEPVTADDVAYTLRTFLSPGASAWMLNTLHAVKGGVSFQQGESGWPIPGVDVIDAYTIRVEFETASPFFLDDLNAIAVQAPMPILPEHVLGNVPDGELFEHDYFTTSMTGSGPWKLVQHAPGQLMELEAFDDFYFGRPGVDRLVIAAIPSLDAVHNAMQRGEIDTSIQGALGPETEEAFLRDPRFDVWATLEPSTVGLGSFNMRIEAVNDPLLHRAWAQAIDKDALFQASARGLGKKVWTPLAHSWYYKDEWDSLHPYDPAASRGLLAAMDWDANRAIKVMVAPSMTDREAADRTAIQQYLEDVGIEVELDTVDPSAWSARFYERKDYEATFGGGPMRGGPAQYLARHWLTCESQPSNPSCDPWGYAEYGKPEWDRLVIEGARTTNRPRAAAHWQMLNEEYLLKDLPVVGGWIGANVKMKNRRFYMPVYGDIPKADTLADIEVYPVHVGRDDHWSYHPEQWEIR